MVIMVANMIWELCSDDGDGEIIMPITLYKCHFKVFIHTLLLSYEIQYSEWPAVLDITFF